nr:hypothetical protein [Tanacetum cinerariifolium]
DGNGEEDQGLRISKEERIQEEEEVDQLYRDVDINQGRGLQVSQDIEDSHVTLTSVHPDGPQESSSVSSFMTSMLNPISDAGVESIFTTASSLIVSLQTPTPIMTPFSIATITTSRDAPIPPTTIPGIILKNLPTFNSAFRFDERLRSLETTFSEYRQTNPFVDAVSEILGNKSIQRSDEQRNLYKALVKAYDADKAILDTYRESTILKQRREEDDQEGPSAGKDRGSKRQRKRGEHASASTPSETATRSAARSTTGSQSRQLSASESAFAEEPVQTTCQMEEPSHPVFETGDAQSWISILARQTDARSLFNELLDTSIDFSNFIMNQIGVATLTPELLAGPTYELMMGHPLPLIPDNRGRRVIPFEHFINNDLKYLRGGASSRKFTTSVTKTNAADYGHIKWIEDLVPRGMWIQEPINYDRYALWGVSHWGQKRQQFYGFAVNQESALDVYSKRRIIAVTELKIVEWHNYKHLDWISLYGFAVNRESALDVYSKRRIIAVTELKIVEWHNYKHLDWISIRRDDDKNYKFKEGDFKRLRLQDIEDMLLLLVQRKLSNLTVEERFSFNVSLRMFTRSIIIQSDGTLNDVRNALDDHLKGIQMQYLPTTIWRRGDKDKAAAMIQAIDKMLNTRRILRSLEKFVGGRLYEGDFRMLQRTI